MAAPTLTSSKVGVGRSFAAVTKSDTTIVNAVGLWVGGAGNVAVIGKNDTVAVTFLAVPAGTYLPFQVSKVMSANTTATNIIAVLN